MTNASANSYEELLSKMTPEQKEELLSLLENREKLIACNKLGTYYPDSGPLRRELYPRHLEFFAAGKDHRERLFCAANRIGKSSAGAYELAVHLTGLYPNWWEGKRFERPISAWAAGESSKTIKDTIQEKLLARPGQFGQGMIPKNCLRRWTPRAGTPDAVETIYVRHVSGGISQIVLKSYEQGTESFQGAELDVIWLDEEPSMSIYTEALTRTMTTDGLVMMTLTPLRGISEVVIQFLPGGKVDNATIPASKYVVMATWDDVPHLDEAAKKDLCASYPPYQRDARTKGIPQLGSGAIYPVPESEVMVAPFAIPAHWPRGFGLDTDAGAGYTAVIWAALDRETGSLFIYDCYKRERAELAVHIAAIRGRGEWIPGVGDAAALIVTPHDAQQIIHLYRQAGINIMLPDKSVEAGIEKVWTMLTAGKLKVFSNCSQWFEEFRLYRRDERGRIVKANDHLMDATRYLCMSGTVRMMTKPEEVYLPPQHFGVWS